MNILMIRSLDSSFDSRVTKESQSLVKAGYKVSILDWDRSQKHKEKRTILQSTAGRVFRITYGYPAISDAGPRKNFISYAKFIFFIRRFVKKHYKEYDIFHLCDLPVMFPLYKIILRRKKKIVYDIFDYYPDQRKWPNYLRNILVSMETACINKANATIICNENRIKQIGDVNPKKLIVIHNSPNLPTRLTQSVINGGGIVSIAYLGSLCDGRFLPEIISVVKDEPNLVLHVAGLGKFQNLFIQEAKCNPRIIYHGKLPYQDVLEVENQCDLLIALYDQSIPNNRYSAPNKFYEALALGKPIVMAKGMGFDDFFAEHSFGIVVDTTKEGIAQGIKQLIARKNEWPSYKKEENSLFQEKYSWGIMEERLFSLYHSLDS